MVVVFVTHNYPRHSGDLPGAFLAPLALALRDRGHDVRVIAPADRGRGGREELDGIPVHRVRYAAPEHETLAYSGRMQEAVRSPAGLLALRGLIRAMRRGARQEAAIEGATSTATVIHAHWWIPAGLALPRELPSLVTLHGTDGRLLRSSRLARWLGRRVLRSAGRVTTVSPELARLVEDVSGRRDVQSHVQPMPAVHVAERWSSGGGGALVVARLFPQKRVELAIRAAGQLAQDGQPLPLTIIGDGSERSELERLAMLLPPEATARIRFTGTLPAAEVAGALERADLLLFPSRDEGLGLAAIEALMAGVPVIACRDGGGVVSALEKHGGGVITDPTPAAVAAAVRQVQSGDLREAARRAGVEWRRELDPARVAGRFEEWYEEALGGA